MSNSSWISATKNSDIAKSHDSGNGIESLSYHRSIWAEEVTVYQDIPSSVIVGKIK